MKTNPQHSQDINPSLFSSTVLSSVCYPQAAEAIVFFLPSRRFQSYRGDKMHTSQGVMISEDRRDKGFWVLREEIAPRSKGSFGFKNLLHCHYTKNNLDPSKVKLQTYKAMYMYVSKWSHWDLQRYRRILTNGPMRSQFICSQLWDLFKRVSTFLLDCTQGEKMDMTGV